MTIEQAHATKVATDDSSAGVRSVVTEMRLAAAPAQTWTGLLYYEEIDEPPPLLLRWLLPVPVKTEGSLAAVGDETLCVYVDGHLRKRVTAVEEAKSLRFDVIEQALDVGKTRLVGGSYTLTPSGDGRTTLSLETRYVSARRPRWVWAWVEAFVCHAFHRHLLSAMRRAIERAPR